MIDSNLAKLPRLPRCTSLLYFLYLIYLLYFQLLTDTPTQQPLLNPFAINPLRTLLISTGGVPPPALPLHPIPILSRAKPRDPLSFHILAHSFALFCARAKLNSFVFRRFRTLCKKKHPGCGGRGLLFFATGRLPQRKQHRLGGRGISDGLELRVLPPERLRHFHLRALQDADEL